MLSARQDARPGRPPASAPARLRPPSPGGQAPSPGEPGSSEAAACPGGRRLRQRRPTRTHGLPQDAVRRTDTRLQTRMCARRPQHPGPPRPLRPPATEALELGGEAGPGREALPRGRVWGALTSPARAFHRELEDGSDGRGSRKGERGHPGSPAVSVGRGRAEGHRGWEAGRRQDIDR